MPVTETKKYSAESITVLKDLQAVRVRPAMYIGVVNALSNFLEVEVKREGNIYRQRFEKGKKVCELEVIGKSDQTGTKITFMPDDTIFETSNFSFDILSNRLRELAFLNSGLKIEFIDERTQKQLVFEYSGGIKSFVEFLNKNKGVVGEIIYLHKERDKMDVEIAIQYNDGYNENIHSFVNNISTIEGGTHLEGFKAALTRVINNYISKKKLNGKNGFS